MSYISGLWCGGKSTQPVSDSETLLSKADSAFLPFMCVHVAAVISQPTTTPSPLHSIPSFSLSLSRHLYLCSTAPAHSSLRWPGRHALSSLFSPWLLAPLQHPSVPLACSPPPSTHPPPLAYVSPSGARWPAWFPGCCCCCCWSSGAVCYDATALPLCTSPPPASHSPLLCNRHLVLQEKATQDSKGGRQRERERERARGRELFIQLLHFSVDLTPLLSCAAGAQRSAEKDWSGGGGESSLKEFYPPLFALPPSVHSWDRVQRSREEKREGLGAGLETQLHSSVSRLAQETHKTNTHTHLRRLEWPDRVQKTDTQQHRQTDRQTWCHGVSGQLRFECFWSAEIRGSTSCWSGSCTAAGWVILLSMPSAALSSLTPPLYFYISPECCTSVLRLHASLWLGEPLFFFYTFKLVSMPSKPSLSHLLFLFFFFFFSPIVSVFQHSSERVVHSCHTKSIPFFFFFKCLNNSPH